EDHSFLKRLSTALILFANSLFNGKPSRANSMAGVKTSSRDNNPYLSNTFINALGTAQTPAANRPSPAMTLVTPRFRYSSIVAAGGAAMLPLTEITLPSLAEYSKIGTSPPNP